MTAPRRYLVRTPLGAMIASFSDRGLAGLAFARESAGRLPRLDNDEGRGEGARGESLIGGLARYFKTGKWRFLIDLDLSSGTDFDRAVWDALRRIPPGEVRTYGEVALSVGRPRAARAVGNACGRNPVAIVVPCHRVVASDGLGGFGAGPGIKRRLLALEGRNV